jgi:hypothetical protein
VSGQDSPDSRAEGGEDPSAGSRGQLSADDQASASVVHPYETSAAVKYLAPAFLSLVTLFLSRRSRRKPAATSDLGQVA